MSSPLTEYWPAFAVFLVPVTGALLMPLFAKLGDKIRDMLAVLFGAATAVSSLAMIPWLMSEHMPGDVSIFTWVNFFGGPLDVGVLVDPLSIMIANVVAVITFLIIVYSTGYMHGDEGLTRYWFLFLYFLASMELLVMSNNLALTLVGWEGVGICSYGLIGYYYRDAKERWLGGPPPTKMYPPSEAGMKAFVVTGLGDVFLLGAIFIIFNFAGTLNYHDLINSASTWMPAMAAVPGLIAITAILFLGGPIGKSAQFPLHEWLPEAMAGPTSVSALIHAATMVKAGVYLVARMSPVFYIGTFTLGLPEAQWYFVAIAVVGAFTCFLAASQAVVSIELKKILAYSTVSQIGYMMLGIGLAGMSEGAYIAGLTASIFHLISHALFKAALFLGAGSVIHAVHSIYTKDMGGLKKYMPTTYILMLLAALSLSGIPPFSGFWSKDAVFISALAVGTPFAYVLLAVGAISAAMTLAYTLRFLYNTFLAPPSEHIVHLEEHGHAPHEAPTVMWGPVAILVVIMLGVSLLGLAGQFSTGLNPELYIEEQMHLSIEHIVPEGVHIEVPHVDALKPTAWALSLCMLAIGGFAGWNFYLKPGADSWAWVQKSGLRKTIWTFLWNRWFLNEGYYAVFVYGLLGLCNALNKYVEGALMSLNDVIPVAAKGTWDQVKRLQTGVVSTNILYIIFLLLFLLFTFIVRGV